MIKAYHDAYHYSISYSNRAAQCVVPRGTRAELGGMEPVEQLLENCEFKGFSGRNRPGIGLE